MDKAEATKFGSNVGWIPFHRKRHLSPRVPAVGGDVDGLTGFRDDVVVDLHGRVKEAVVVEWDFRAKYPDGP
jgi:hypothetical protein